MSDSMQVSVNPQVMQIQEKLLELETKLNENAPGIPVLLREIHNTLKKDSDVVTLLSEEECAILVRGLKKQTNTEIAVSALKKSTKKSLKSMTVSDL